MNLKLLCLLTSLLCSGARCAVVITYRDTDANIYGFSGNPVDFNFDVNADGVSDYRFLRDGGLVAAFQSYGDNRFISTLADSPNFGGYVDPVSAETLIGFNASSLLGSWHRHTDNGGASGFGLNFGPRAMQYQNAYIGLEFKISGQTHYGWIQFEGYSHPSVVFPVYDETGNIVTYVNVPSILGGRISSWGYETEPGKSIIVGAVPEPSSALVVAVCAAISCLRRKRHDFGESNGGNNFL